MFAALEKNIKIPYHKVQSSGHMCNTRNLKKELFELKYSFPKGTVENVTCNAMNGQREHLSHFVDSGSRLSLSRPRLSQISAYLEVKFWSLF